ncbi:HD domain-containing phosphohydrolase [Chloroflexota bacterium]
MINTSHNHMGHTDIPTIPIRSKRILVVEHNSQVLDAISQFLEIEGYTVYRAHNEEIGLKYMQQLMPDLIIADINSSGSDNMIFYRTVRKNQLWVTIPFIFLTSHGSPDEIQRGREMGVEDYLVKPVDPSHLAKIVNARLLRTAELQVALIDQAYLETINVLANTIEGRDPYTHGHVQRVSNYAQKLAERLGWPKENLRMLAFGARLHDIGKIIVPDDILKKPGDLGSKEWTLMRQHPEAGEKILRNITHLQPAIPYVLYHHERWDGSGYPHNLQGREIPIEGRLLAIVDVYDALSTTRPYHPARPISEVIQYMTIRAGKHFDPDLVPIFIEVLQEQANL